MKFKYILLAGVLVSGLNVVAAEEKKQTNSIDLSALEPLSPVQGSEAGESDVSETARAMAGDGLLSDDGAEEHVEVRAAPGQRPSQVFVDAGVGLGLLPESNFKSRNGTMDSEIADALQFTHALKPQPSPDTKRGFDTWFDIVKDNKDQLKIGLSSYGSKHKQFHEQITERINELEQQEKEQQSKRAASPAPILSQAVDAAPSATEAARAVQQEPMSLEQAAKNLGAQIRASDAHVEGATDKPYNKPLPNGFTRERSWKPWIFGASIMAIAAAVVGYIWWLKHPTVAAR